MASLLLMLLLTSCLTSETPLLDGRDTPFPATFRWVPVDANNNIEIDEKTGVPGDVNFKQVGLSYVDMGSKDAKPDAKPPVLTLRTYDTATNMYGAQVDDSRKGGAGYIYFLLQKDGNTITTYSSSAEIDSLIVNELNRISNGQNKSSGWPKLTSKADLDTAFQITFRNRGKSDILRFRMASTASELSSLDNEIAVAKSRWAASRNAAPPASAPPAPSASAPSPALAVPESMGQWKLSRFSDPMTDNTVFAMTLTSQRDEGNWSKAVLIMSCDVGKQQSNLLIDWATPLQELLPGGAIPVVSVLARFDKDPPRLLGWHILKQGLVEARNNGGQLMETLARAQGSMGDTRLQDIKFVFAEEFFGSLGNARSLLLRTTDAQGNSLTSSFNVEGSRAAAGALVKACKR